MDAVIQNIEEGAVRTAIAEDHALLVCKTCGMQYDEREPSRLVVANGCPVCLDPRQYVPESGQAWTRIGDWLREGKLTCELRQEPGDARIFRIIARNLSVGIGQTPIVIVTQHGIVIWDCCALLTPELFVALKGLMKQHDVPLLGMAISHPHFYTTALTWAKALETKIFVSHLDRQWWMRKADPDALEKHLVFYQSSQHRLASGITIVRCGGHFDGSAVLHWDRTLAPAPPSIASQAVDEQIPSTGAVFCADTFAPGMDRKTITFLWSYPNFIPLPPSSVLQIWKAVRPFAFDDIIGGWPGRYVHGKARAHLLASAKQFVEMEGHDVDRFDWGE